jgi:lipopolysaccharide biosynthesis regulator YciM
MDLDWQWLLIVPAVAFALGWLASRLDLRQWKRSDRDAPKAYFKGLNLLLNEQTDKAVDAFIEAVQHDPDTSELHFALGNLFRRRGEFERAVRVHQHLLQRGDLSQADRQRAQHALANDFMKAGLFDRAEEAFRALQGTPFATEARLALLGLFERSRDWRAAADIATQLEQTGTGSFAKRVAHYQCEIALEADARGDTAAAEAALAAARQVAPQAVRPLIQQAQRLARLGQAAAAFELGNTLRQLNPEALVRIAGDYVAWAQGCGQQAAARDALEQLYTPGRSARLPELLRTQPTLSAAQDLLDTPSDQWPESARESVRLGVRDAVSRAARPLQRYRCAACGFEAQRYFWQCPGCLNWDSFPPQHIESL